MTRTLTSTTVLAVACSLFATSAAAAPAAPSASDAAPAMRATIVLEAHVGERTSIAAVDAVRDELERRGFITCPADIVKRLGGQAPQPGILDPEETIEDILTLSTQGFDAYTRAEYETAVAMLGRAVHLIKRNPALLVRDAANARIPFHAFIGLAQSQAKLGDLAGSTETMTELLRTLSTRTIDRAAYGPEAEKAYRTVQKQAEALGRGQLSISIDDDRAEIFLDSERRGTGEAQLADLIPGAYRVFVRVPGGGDRQYQVEVRADRQTTLAVEWQVDAALTVSAPWIGFAFASEAARDRAPAYAGSLARRWGYETIVVIDTVALQGKPIVRGTLYHRDGHVVRTAWAVADGGEAKLRSLGRFIADGTPSPDLHEGQRSDARDRLSDERGNELPAWPFVTGGAIAIGLGIGLLAIDQDYGHVDARGVRTPYYVNTAPWGVAASVAGATSIAFGVWWWRRHRSPAPSFSVGTSHISLGLSGAF